MDNITQQADEIEVLKSIFGDQWKYNSSTDTYSMEIEKNTEIWINLNADYPSDRPPKYELLAPYFTLSQKRQVDESFREIYENERGPIIFQWIEKLKEIATEKPKDKDCDKNLEVPVQEIENPMNITDKLKELKVTHGSIIVDRKSTFQGHVCHVYNQEDVRYFMEYLLQNKKIAQATHNISAYRIAVPSKTMLQDCDDDGEAHAGGRLLHLLQILDVENVMVVVSRWYGGIHLGPDRFKHINNAARQVLVEAGILKS